MELTQVLRGGRQCDEDGTEIIMSRQACHEAANEIERLNLELQKRDKCSFMGPMRDCPTHGESEELKHLRAEVSAWRERLGDDYEYNPDVPYVVMKTPNGEVRGASRPAGEASSAEGATSTVVLCGDENGE